MSGLNQAPEDFIFRRFLSDLTFFHDCIHKYPFVFDANPQENRRKCNFHKKYACFLSLLHLHLIAKTHNMKLEVPGSIFPQPLWRDTPLPVSLFH